MLSEILIECVSVSEIEYARPKVNKLATILSISCAPKLLILRLTHNLLKLYRHQQTLQTA